MKWVATGIMSVVAAVAILLGVVVVAGITVDLSWLRGKIESVSGSALQRPVTLAGPITLLPTLRPTVQVENVLIGNPEGWSDGDFVQLDLARAGLAGHGADAVLVLLAPRPMVLVHPGSPSLLFSPGSAHLLEVDLDLSGRDCSVPRLIASQGAAI